MGETSGDPGDGASSLKRTSGTFAGTSGLQLLADEVAAFSYTCSNQPIKPACRVVKVIRYQRIRTTEQVKQHKQVLGGQYR